MPSTTMLRSQRGSGRDLRLDLRLRRGCWCMPSSTRMASRLPMDRIESSTQLLRQPQPLPGAAARKVTRPGGAVQEPDGPSRIPQLRRLQQRRPRTDSPRSPATARPSSANTPRTDSPHPTARRRPTIPNSTSSHLNRLHCRLPLHFPYPSHNHVTSSTKYLRGNSPISP